MLNDTTKNIFFLIFTFFYEILKKLKVDNFKNNHSSLQYTTSKQTAFKQANSIQASKQHSSKQTVSNGYCQDPSSLAHGERLGV